MTYFRFALPTIPALALASATAIAPAAADEGIASFKATMKSHPSQGDVRRIDGATAALMTTAAGAFVSVSTSGLTPGNVHTVWFVAINDPAACETSPCKTLDVLKRTAMTKSDVGFADGLIVGADGTAEFAGHVPVGDLRGAWFENGYQQAQTAEIHLVIQDHGPLISELAEEMTTSYRGGCTDESLPPPVPDTARADGTPGPNTCRMVQFTIFEQTGDQSAALE